MEVALIVVAVGVASTAFANGRLPGATGLAIHPTDERQILLGLTYGLALTRDGGASWTWMCEEQIEGNGGDVDPSIVVTGDGSLVVLSLTNGGVLVSGNDGCTFERALGPLQGNRGVDLTLDPSQSSRVLGLLSTIVGEVDRHPVYRNLLAHSLDHGKSWQILAELPDDFSAETVEIAASDPNRIYVSGTASTDPLEGIVERSDDGGRSWTRHTVRLPRGSGSLFISAIHPSDPDRLWFRVPGRGDIYGVLPARLWASADGALTFSPIADTHYGMLGFALSPDGDRIAFGGPLDGLFIAPADASAPPNKVSALQVKCLRWNASGLYACAGEPTDPYSLGLARDPTQAFAPLWQRADTCREACPASATLELTCRAPWETVAPMIGATAAVCGAEPMPDAGSAAGPAMPSLDAAAASFDAAHASLDASPVTPTSTRPSSGCAVDHRAGRPYWLTLLIMFVRRRRRAL